MTNLIERYVGQGIYTVPEVSRLTGATSPNIYNWLYGGSLTAYIEGHPYRHPALEHQFRLMDHIANVSFKDLIQIRFVRFFRTKGVPLQTIRKAALNAGKLLSTTHPFCSAKFKTDGINLLAEVKEVDGNFSLVELKTLQHVFKNVIDPFLSTLGYDDTEVNRWWPELGRGKIIIDPERNFGKPTLPEEGYPTETIYEAFLANSQSVETVSEWFEIPKESVMNAISFEKQLAV